MKKLNPNFMVKDVKASIEFYKNILGFELIMAVPESQNTVLTKDIENANIVYALVKNGNVEIMFQSESSFKQDVPTLENLSIGASVSFYIEVEDIENFYNTIKDKIEVTKGLFTTWYGMKEFYIRDNNGYILCFAEQGK